MKLLHLPEQANVALYGGSIPHCKAVNKEQSHTPRAGTSTPPVRSWFRSWSNGP